MHHVAMHIGGSACLLLSSQAGVIHSLIDSSVLGCASCEPGNLRESMHDNTVNCICPPVSLHLHVPVFQQLNEAASMPTKMGGTQPAACILTAQLYLYMHT